MEQRSPLEPPSISVPGVGRRCQAWSCYDINRYRHLLAEGETAICSLSVMSSSVFTRRIMLSGISGRLERCGNATNTEQIQKDGTVFQASRQRGLILVEIHCAHSHKPTKPARGQLHHNRSSVHVDTTASNINHPVPLHSLFSLGCTRPRFTWVV